MKKKIKDYFDEHGILETIGVVIVIIAAIALIIFNLTPQY